MGPSALLVTGCAMRFSAFLLGVIHAYLTDRHIPMLAGADADADRILNALDRDVEIVIKPKKHGAQHGSTSVMVA